MKRKNDVAEVDVQPNKKRRTLKEASHSLIERPSSFCPSKSFLLTLKMRSTFEGNQRVHLKTPFMIRLVT
jgi:hypothetical protein